MLTRVHSFEYAPPELVERQLRMLIPETRNVTVNPAVNQVIVNADAATQEKVASMLRQLGRPPANLHFRMWHNRNERSFAVRDGVLFSMPVSQTPPESVVEHARSRLAPEQRDQPPAGTALQAHVHLLRDDPPTARLRLVPGVLFGVAHPYEVVSYDELATDILVPADEYIEIRERLASHSFFSGFLRTQPREGQRARPVSLLLSLERLSFGELEEEEEFEPEN